MFMDGSMLPPVLDAFGRKHLRQALDPTLPPTLRSNLTQTQQQNLKDILAKIEEDKAVGLLDGCHLVVFPVDRGMGKVYKQSYRKDICPTLTCHNRYLFVVSLDDLDALDDDKAFFRFLHPREWLQLQ